MRYLATVSAFACGALMMASATLSSAQSSYSITDLGVIDSNGYSLAKSVNTAGQVTGSAGTTNTNLSEVFLYSNGAMSSLGTLGGSSGIGNAINASGQVAGYSQNASKTYRAFLSSGGSMKDIGDLGGGSAVAYGMNDLGFVVGSAVTKNGENHPFLYRNGKMIDLGTLGSKNNNWWNVAQAVNNSGVVAGTSYDATGNFFGFVWKAGKMTKMGTLGGAWSQGYAINGKGQITGLAYTKNGSAHAFIANCGSCPLKDLGTITGSTSTVWGFAINDAGVVVGRTTFQNTYHAFVYSGGKMKDLNSLILAGSGWELTEANGINSAGQIVGMGTIHGQQHGYLLTPQ